MTTKTVTINLVDVAHEVANGVATGVAIGLMNNIVSKMKDKVPSAERDGIKVFGLEAVTFQHFHTLTPAEEVEAALALVEETKALAAATNARLDAVQALIPETGPLSEEQADALRAALAAPAI